MIDNNFADLDLAELKGMLRNLDMAIAVKEQQAVVTARRAVEATAREHDSRWRTFMAAISSQAGRRNRNT